MLAQLFELCNSRHSRIILINLFRMSKFSPVSGECMFYHQDPLKCVKDIRTFLGLNIKDTFCEAVVEACSFDKLKMKESLDIKDGVLVDIWKENSGGTIYRKGKCDAKYIILFGTQY